MDGDSAEVKKVADLLKVRAQGVVRAAQEAIEQDLTPSTSDLVLWGFALTAQAELALENDDRPGAARAALSLCACAACGALQANPQIRKNARFLNVKPLAEQMSAHVEERGDLGELTADIRQSLKMLAATIVGVSPSVQVPNPLWPYEEQDKDAQARLTNSFHLVLVHALELLVALREDPADEPSPMPTAEAPEEELPGVDEMLKQASELEELMKPEIERVSGGGRPSNERLETYAEYVRKFNLLACAAGAEAVSSLDEVREQLEQQGLPTPGEAVALIERLELADPDPDLQTDLDAAREAAAAYEDAGDAVRDPVADALVTLASAVQGNDRAHDLNARLESMVNGGLKPSLILPGNLDRLRVGEAAVEPSREPTEGNTQEQPETVHEGSTSVAPKQHRREAVQEPGSETANEDASEVPPAPDGGGQTVASELSEPAQANRPNGTTVQSEAPGDEAPETDEASQDGPADSVAAAEPHAAGVEQLFTQMLDADRPATAGALSDLCTLEPRRWFFQLVLLSRAASPDNDEVVSALETRLLELGQFQTSTLPEALMVAATAFRVLRPNPFGAGTQAIRQVLPELAAFGSTEESCKAVVEAALRGQLPSSAEDSEEAEGSAEAANRAAVRRAEELLDRLPKKKHNFHPATRVLQGWMAEEGPLGSMLRIAARDAHSERDTVRAIAQEYSDRTCLERAMNEAYAEFARRKRAPKIEANARTWLAERAAEAVAVGREWLSSLEDLDSALAADRRLGTGGATIKRRLRDLDPAVRDELDGLVKHQGPTGFAAREFLAAWAELLDPSDAMGGNPLGALTQDQALSSDLFLTRLAVKAGEIVGEVGEADLIDAAGTAMAVGWLEALTNRLNDDDIEGAFVASRFAAAAQIDVPRDLLDELEAASTRARQRLRAEVVETRTRVQRQLRCGLVNATEYEEAIVALPEIDHQSHPNGPVVRAALSEVSRLLEERADAARGRILDRLDELGADDGVRTRISEVCQEEQFDVAEEHLGRLERQEPLPPVEAATDWLSQFDAFATGVARARSLIDGAKKGVDLGEGRETPRLSTDSKKRLNLELQAMDSLRRPKTDPSKFSSAVKTVLASIGFEPEGHIRPDKGRPHSDAADFRSGSPLGSFVPPEFGSSAGGRYRVIVVRTMIKEKDLVSIIREDRAKHKLPTVVLWAAEERPPPWRRNLARAARESRATFLFVDRLILAFKTAVSEMEGALNRSSFDLVLAASLPLAYINPYSYVGSVAPEMFFGRTVEVETLEDPAGACFVYGGRQLGKSVLLKTVQRRLSTSGPDTRVELIDLKAQGVGERLPASGLWTVVNQRLDHMKIPDETGEENPASRASARILGWLDDDPSRRLLLLLDETDRFLDADAPPPKEGEAAAFRNVLTLRDLMDRTDRRFKVVFAGLHNVNRFRRIPNQPLAHFGKPEPIGPLNWRDACDLVEVPMTAMGFRLEPPTLVDRILVETRRHPSLIQLYCRSLVEHFTQGARSGLSVPITITAEALDEVERSHDLLERVRERFEWTLDLDPRYRVLALEVARLSLGDQEVRARGITAAALREAVRDRWPDGFKGVTGDEFRVLLGEMVDLEVFASAGQDRFRLPTSNVLRLFGDEEGIEFQFLELIESIAEPAEYTPSRLRRQLQERSPVELSPLSLGNEATLLARPDERSVAIRVVLGTAAHGVGRVKDGVQSAVTESAANLHLTELDADALERYARSPGASDGGQIFILTLPAGGLAAEMRRIASTASQLKSGTVVVVVVDEKAADEWLQLVDAVELANDGDPLGQCELVELRRWDQAQLDAWIDTLEVPASKDVRRKLLELTGGWASILTDLGSDWLSTKQMSPAESVKQLGADPSRLLRLVDQLGVDRVSGAQRVMVVLQEVDLASARDVAELTDQSVASAAETLESLRMLGAVESDDDNHFKLDPVFGRALQATV